MSKMIHPGQIYEKDGVRVDVHAVRDGEVFYQLWPAGVVEQMVWERLYRRTLEDFALQAGVATHRYVWGNNEKRASMKGRVCRILASGRMSSVLVEFENGQKEIISRRSLRKVTP